MESKEFIMVEKKGEPKLVKLRTIKHKKIKDGKDIKNIARLFEDIYHVTELTEEYAYILAFRKDKPIGLFQVSHGTVQSCEMNMNTIYKFILLLGADGFVICHNHPNERNEMSQDDFNRTMEMIALSKLLHIKFYSHLIFGNNGYRQAELDVYEMNVLQITDTQKFYASEKGD